MGAIPVLAENRQAVETTRENVVPPSLNINSQRTSHTKSIAQSTTRVNQLLNVKMSPRWFEGLTLLYA
jgi:hypothetical protein